MKKIYLILSLLILSLYSIADTHYVNAGIFYYSPQTLTISQGDTVIWLNDQGYHNVNGVTSTINGLDYNNPEPFFSSPTPNYELYTHVFNISGSYTYDCSVGNHAAAGMVGYIIVEALLLSPPLLH